MVWTDWVREVERDRNALERILALLLAFAGLADRASGLPALQRFHVLRVLGRAEARAQAALTGMACGTSDETSTAAFRAADDAARLAASFRALALVLGAMLARAIRGQFTCFPRSRFRMRRAYRWEISKLSPYFLLRLAARGPPEPLVRTELTRP